jgi:hypothetical protein
MFMNGQKVWTPEIGWGKFERLLQSKPDTAFICRDGKLTEVRLSTIATSEFNKNAAAELVPYVKSIYLTDNDVAACAEWISQNSHLSPIEAIDYVRESPRGHRTKADIEAPGAPQELLIRLGVALDSRNLAGYLMREYNLLPVKHTA